MLFRTHVQARLVEQELVRAGLRSCPAVLPAWVFGYQALCACLLS